MLCSRSFALMVAGDLAHSLPRPLRTGQRLCLARLERAEVRGAGAADRAEPVFGDVLESGAGRDAPVRVADRGVVDEPAAVADPQGHFLGRGHGWILEERYFVPK